MSADANTAGLNRALIEKLSIVRRPRSDHEDRTGDQITRRACAVLMTTDVQLVAYSNQKRERDGQKHKARSRVGANLETR